MSGRKLALASGCQMDWSRECKRSKVILRTSVESSDQQDQSRVTVVGAEEIGQHVQFRPPLDRSWYSVDMG